MINNRSLIRSHVGKQNKPMKIKDILQKSRFIPVITLYHEQQAEPLIQTLIQEGVKAIEITLRTPIAFDILEKLKKIIPTNQCVIGAGTVTSVQQYNRLQAIGIDFIVSPGMDPMLTQAIQQGETPYLPGVCTPSDIMVAMNAGYHFLKFFPAELAGGIPMLKEFANLFPHIQFCPTGGINLTNVQDYLTLPNVIAAGGSWLTPTNTIKAENFNQIKNIVKETKQMIEKIK